MGMGKLRHVVVWCCICIVFACSAECLLARLPQSWCSQHLALVLLLFYTCKHSELELLTFGNYQAGSSTFPKVPNDLANVAHTVLLAELTAVVLFLSPESQEPRWLHCSRGCSSSPVAEAEMHCCM